MAARALFVVAALLPLVVAGTAHADPDDDKFLTALRSEGITDHLSVGHAIQAGHHVCEELDQGMTVTEVGNDLLASSFMPAYDCGFFVGASIDAYCPQYKSDIAAGT